jgi:hypothetical protein
MRGARKQGPHQLGNFNIDKLQIQKDVNAWFIDRQFPAYCEGVCLYGSDSEVIVIPTSADV